MKKRLPWLSLLAGGALMAETALPLANPGFEEGMNGWNADKLNFRLDKEPHGGKWFLRVDDQSTTAGSSCRSLYLKVTSGKSYAVRFWGRNAGSSAVGVYLQFHDAQNKQLNTPEKRNELILSVPNTNGKWVNYTLVGKAPEGAVSMSVWIHSYNGAVGTADLDDFSVSELTPKEELTVKSTIVAENTARRFPVLSQERIKEIAAMLPDKPEGNGPSASNREAWDKLLATPEAQAIIKRAEDIIDTPPPVLPDEIYLEFTKNGNRRNFERLLGNRNGRISTLGLAEALEYKGRFLPTLERDLEALCDYRSWVMPAHDAGLENFYQKRNYSDLGCTAICRDLANIDWWLQDKLSSRIRQRIRTEIHKRMIDPYLEVIRTGIVSGGHWWIIGGNNWNAVCTSNMVGTSLILLEDKMDRAEVLAAMEHSNKIFLTSFTPDGNCSEGMGYWGYGFGHYMTMGETVFNATNGKLNIYETTPEHVAKVCAYARDMQIEEDCCPAFADCGIGSRPDSTTLLFIQRRFPETLLQRQEGTRTVARGMTALGLLAFSDETPYAAKAPEHPTFPVRSLFANANIYIGRAQDADKGNWGIALKGGHNNELHNHNDVGSFTVVLNKKTYFLDPGSETYTKQTFSAQRYERDMLNSFGHPVPLVAGRKQTGGAQSRGSFVKTDFTDDVDTVVLDFKDAYRDAPDLQDLMRTFTFDRKNRVITIRDDVKFANPQAFGNALLTYSKVFERKQGEIIAYDGNGGIQANITAIGGEWSYDPEPIDTINGNKPMRLGFNFKQPVKEASIIITLKPAELTDDLPGFYRAPDEATFKPQIDKAVTVEAENLAKQENGEVLIEEKPGASKQAFKLWDKTGHRLTWTFEVPTAGHYAVLVRECHQFGDGVARHAFLDGKQLNDEKTPYLFPGTGGWSSVTDQWKNAWMADDKAQALILNLSAGKHEFAMENADGRGLNLDWIKFVPAK